MRRRLRERAQPAGGTTRKRKSRSAEVEEEEEEGLVSDLDELLRAKEEEVAAAAAWWTEECEQPPDSTLTDLLQQLAACDEGESALLGPEFEAAPPKMAPAAEQRAARGGNKNALAARLNRLRKKEYVSGLEGKVARLSEDNQRLERERRSLGERVSRLEEETRYLRAVLANDSALSQLLDRLTGVGGVRLTTSLFSEREQREHDYARPAEDPEPPIGGGVRLQVNQKMSMESPIFGEMEKVEPPGGGGVCLHVNKEKVSVEFCPACARSAARSAKM